jgi:hypothetical protein
MPSLFPCSPTCKTRSADGGRALLTERESLRETIIGVNDVRVSDTATLLSPHLRFQFFSDFLLRSEVHFSKPWREVLFAPRVRRVLT